MRSFCPLSGPFKYEMRQKRKGRNNYPVLHCTFNGMDKNVEVSRSGKVVLPASKSLATRVSSLGSGYPTSNISS